MYDVSVPMALVDYIPVALFLLSGIYLMRDLYGKMTKYAFALLAGGTINTTLAGFLKATWKLLYAAGICDFQVLNKMLLPTQSLGLLMTGLSLVLMLAVKSGKKLRSAAPPVFAGTMIFIPLMVLGLGGICSSLSIIAKRMKKGWLIPLFILCFFCYMTMGYLASRDGTLAWVNWVEQGVNILGQVLLLFGVLTLHKAGLKDLEL